MKRRMALFVFACLLGLLTLPVAAEEQFTYISQPEEVVIFLNDIAFVRDTLKLTGDSDAQIVLPDRVYQDTLIVRENGERVPAYSVDYNRDGQFVLHILQPQATDIREITLEYLTSGLSWKPNYDMGLTGSQAESVQFVFYAQIQNNTFALDGVKVTLAAGRVDTSRQLDAVSTVTANQYIAGYEEMNTEASLAAGAVTIQYLYELGDLDSNPGDTLYIKVLDEILPARQVLLWNAQRDKQVTVIYKVRNESTLALAEGTVRSYQDGLFIGSDFIEFTPIGSEGSVTVGGLQDVRVNRTETRTYLDGAPADADMQHEITLTMSNFTDSPVEMEVVDGWPPSASRFAFSHEPGGKDNNLFRWSLTIPAGETQTITYEYRTD